MSILKRFFLLFLSVIPHVTIIVDGKPYLTRYYLLLRDWRWFSLYLHHFHASDQYQQLHNHPWKWGVSFVLWGGYIEERIRYDLFKMLARVYDAIEIRKVSPGTFNVIKSSDFHRVELTDSVNGAWTIFAAGPRHPNEWGFLDRDSREYTHYTNNPNAIP